MTWKKSDGLKRIRISSIEASQITDEIIEVLANSKKVVRHLHIPIQSGSDTVLKRMRRKYTMDFFGDRIEKLKIALPGLAVTSDVIVGFPGETEEEFMETYNFIEKYKFSELHVFPYSKRTGTPAARMEDQVDEDIKNERVHRLIALSDQLAKEYASRFEGEVLEVIPENDWKMAYMRATQRNIYEFFPASEEMIGEIVKVKITKSGYPFSEGQFVTVRKGFSDSTSSQYVRQRLSLSFFVLRCVVSALYGCLFALYKPWYHLKYVMLKGGFKCQPNVASIIDHTLLKADATKEQIKVLCEEAREYTLLLFV